MQIRFISNNPISQTTELHRNEISRRFTYVTVSHRTKLFPLVFVIYVECERTSPRMTPKSYLSDKYLPENYAIYAQFLLFTGTITGCTSGRGRLMVVCPLRTHLKNFHFLVKKFIFIFTKFGVHLPSFT